MSSYACANEKKEKRENVFNDIKYFKSFNVNGFSMNGNFTRKMLGFEQIIQFGAKLRIFFCFIFSNNLNTGLRDLDFNKNFRERWTVMIRSATRETFFSTTLNKYVYIYICIYFFLKTSMSILYWTNVIAYFIQCYI